MQVIVAGVMPCELYTIDKPRQLICTATALTENSFTINAEADEVRGGTSNMLQGKYFHNSSFKAQLTSATVSLEYIAMKIGSGIQVGAEVWEQESVVVSTANEIVISKTPTRLPYDTIDDDIYGFYKLPNESDENWKPIVFNAETKKAEVNGLTVGTTVCVKYVSTNSGARKIEVASEIIPKIVYMVMKVPELQVSQVGVEDISSSSKIGEMQITVPKFLLTPHIEMKNTASAHGTMQLDGEALVCYDGTCGGSGRYATITEFIYNKDDLADASGLYIKNSNIDDLVAHDTVKLEVYATYNGLTMPKKIDNSKLTFTIGDQAIATVSNAGVITAVGTGHTTVEVVATAKPTLSCGGSVEVKAQA